MHTIDTKGKFVEIKILIAYRLSEREKLDYVYKKKLYQLASEHEKASNGFTRWH